jgi:hypothetical protein
MTRAASEEGARATEPQERDGVAPGTNGVCASTTSPSLLGVVGGAAAYELKLLLTDALAAQVELWARERLAFDPHADPALENAYRIHTLYLDTEALDGYRRTPTFARRKFRIRRYGTEPCLFLERKTRSGRRVRKRRTPIMDAELDRVHLPQPDGTWEGSWFQRRLLARRLQPACQITYDRVAHVGMENDSPLRLTLDRGIVGARASAWDVTEPREGKRLLAGQVVLELKYRSTLPALFKRLIHEFRLTPQPVSKYRRCIEAWGEASP